LFLIPLILWFFCYSVYAVPPLSAFPVLLEEALPGQMIVAPGKIICSAGRRAVILSVSNQADRPIQVSILLSELPVVCMDLISAFQLQTCPSGETIKKIVPDKWNGVH